ncbi:D-glycero-D-manno-heptose 1-phosphate guanosyltransferase, partial [Campylobacter jejuni]|nr:D-glycero-D-manno-heptose 1-phosphate guanosyltransferase [Campylobacter jejuni]
FSFEEFLQENCEKLKTRAEIFNDYFIDIGVPEDYKKYLELNTKEKYVILER